MLGLKYYNLTLWANFNISGIELTFLLSSGESLFVKIDSLKDSLYALFSQHKIEKLLKLLLLSSCNNRWSDITDGLHATLFPVKTFVQ